MSAAAARVLPTIQAIREQSVERGCFSWTSLRYQNDVLRFAAENDARGGCLVEVGCFRGGLSVQLACVAKELEMPFYTMDIDANAVTTTTEHLEHFGLAAHSTVFHGSLSAFVDSVALPAAPVLVVVDGDHDFEGVRRDARAIARMKPAPFALAFHDFCLRSPHTDERVDDAVREMFPDAPRIPMGTSLEDDSTLPTEMTPAEDGHFWKSGGTEGCFVICGHDAESRGRTGLIARFLR